MSGDFRPEQNTIIEATDDEQLAKQHGLNYFDEDRGQYVKRDVTEHGGNEDPAREQVWTPEDVADNDEDAGDGEFPDETDQERYDREHDSAQQQDGFPPTVADEDAAQTKDAEVK